MLVATIPKWNATTADGDTELSVLDSKKKSASEAFVNSFGGYPVGYALGIVILPVSTGWIESDPYVANIAITGVYATVSFVRSYVLRRVFEKYGIDDNFLRVGIKFAKKIIRGSN